MVHIRLHLNTMSLEQTLALASALGLVVASVQELVPELELASAAALARG